MDYDERKLIDAANAARQRAEDEASRLRDELLRNQSYTDAEAIKLRAEAERYARGMHDADARFELAAEKVRALELQVGEMREALAFCVDEYGCSYSAQGEYDGCEKNFGARRCAICRARRLLHGADKRKDESGEVHCPGCGATAMCACEDKRVERCLECSGSGEIGLADGEVPCPTCGGSGDPTKPGAYAQKRKDDTLPPGHYRTHGGLVAGPDSAH